MARDSCAPCGLHSETVLASSNDVNAQGGIGKLSTTHAESLAARGELSPRRHAGGNMAGGAAPYRVNRNF
jgi:hypothetical protein